jgi:hypothetical protein
MKSHLYLLLFLLPFQAFTQQKPMLISYQDLEIDTKLQQPKDKSYRNYTYKRDAKGNVLECLETYHSDDFPEVKNNEKDTYIYHEQGNELSSVNESWISTTNSWCCKLIHEQTYEGKKMMTHTFTKEIRTGKIVPQFKDFFKYDASENRIEELNQKYDTLLNKYVDAIVSIKYI